MKTENELFRELAPQAAAWLAGRPVTIKWIQPPEEFALGSALKTRTGAIVYIRPNMSLDTQVETLLHELAHVRLHWEVMPETFDNRPSGSIRREQTRQLGDVIHRPVEDEAETLKAEWLIFANSKFSYSPGPQQILQALMGWIPPEIEQAVKNSVNKALSELRKEKQK